RPAAGPRHSRRAATHARRAVRERAPQRGRLLRDGGDGERPGALPGRADLVLADPRPRRRRRPAPGRAHPRGAGRTRPRRRGGGAVRDARRGWGYLGAKRPLRLPARATPPLLRWGVWGVETPP